MMENVPFDTSDPVVRDYLALVRLQVLTPLSLLVNIATLVVCAIVVSPNLEEISNDYRTTVTPSPWMIYMYVIAVWVGQIGYCGLLVLARKPETKSTLINGAGHWLVWTNWVVAFWAVAFISRAFLVATILLGIALVLLVVSNLGLIWLHPPTSHRPLDTALIHAPLRFFLILPLMVLFAQSLFIAMDHYWLPGTPQSFDRHPWEGFAVVFGTNILGLFIVVFRRDVVWTVGATWINAAIFTRRPKTLAVNATAITFAVLMPLALVASALVKRLAHPRVLEATKPSNSPRTGAIALPPDEEAGTLPIGSAAPPPGAAGTSANVQPSAREVDAEAVWG